jgi:hypothetical protein
MMFDEKTNRTFCTADLWRAAQQSRSAYLGFWLRSLFRKPLTYSLKESEQDAPLCVVLAFSQHKPEITDSITKYPSPQAQKATAAWPAADIFASSTTNRETI